MHSFSYNFSFFNINILSAAALILIGSIFLSIRPFSAALCSSIYILISLTYFREISFLFASRVHVSFHHHLHRQPGWYKVPVKVPELDLSAEVPIKLVKR
jgi:membrane-anchored protein YejM (alkaline phosphatase superfamily)